MRKPLVTIGIPTWNYGCFLGEAIGSALAQTYENIEVVVSDNASTDGTREVVRQFDDPRLRYYRNASNLGVYRNWNNCLHLASGEAKYFKILQADDVLDPFFVDTAVGILESNPEASLLQTAFRVFGDESSEHLYCRAPVGEVVVMSGPEKVRAMPDLSFAVPPTSNIFRRGLAIGLGGYLPDDAGAMSSDFVLWLALLDQGDVIVVNRILCSQRSHSRQDRRTRRDTLRVLDDVLPALSRFVAREPLGDRRRAADVMTRRLAEPFLWHSLRALATGRPRRFAQVVRRLHEFGCLGGAVASAAVHSLEVVLGRVAKKLLRPRAASPKGSAGGSV